MLQQQEVLTLARGFLQEKKYKHLRNFVKVRDTTLALCCTMFSKGRVEAARFLV
jgi:hypothetical protein